MPPTPHRRLVALALLLSLAAPAMAAPKRSRPAATTDHPPAAVIAAGRAVDPARLEAHVRALADDAMEGRGTGTPGYDRAAHYVAEWMQELGLEPGGDGGYLQPVPLLRARLRSEACAFELRRGDESLPLEVGRDVLLAPDFLRTKWTTEAPLVFVGYGVSAPELNHDDYAGVDVRGKVVVQFRGAPPRFPNDERAYYSNGQMKDQMAVARGAIGVLTLIKPSDEARQPWARNMRQNRLPGFRWLDEGGAPAQTHAGLEITGQVGRTAAERLFDGAAVDFLTAATDADSSRAQGFPLTWSVKAVRVTEQERASSPNVIGVLRGSDPRLRDECIVVSAHLDHLGIGEPVHGDSIHNGAYDNASGVAMMLETARAFTAPGARPRRSVVFLAVTGEEKGLQGSDHFAQHPAPDSMTVVGNVNLDMVLLLRPLRKVVAIGAEHSSFAGVMSRAATLAGLELIPDPTPAEVVFVRSDQFSFVRQGIPAVFPVSGHDGSAEGRDEVAGWRVDHYHGPNDDLSQPFDWPSGARFTSMAFWATWLAADAARAPHWNPGDFFGTRFGPRP